MRKIRTRKDVVEAIQFTGENSIEVAKFLHDKNPDMEDGCYVIGRFLGDHGTGRFVSVGDWVVRDYLGLISVCKTEYISDCE